ncbi:hypothetical protein SAMN02745163_02454 [Clostridium cavendishii DSM 21758]|uniref:Uncharacterized protein n=1 Tax=Clostridium cavendishii DSM 21758 TaxID=1121302 RepID=A0A1M6LQ31_9CLOT|nr:hypothetical protein [Clostridium cavendishii]SHJ73285.1 hypothetical protein SAMN02745163_02454 [Clostridium cavendishii DSM 21758]
MTNQYPKVNLDITVIPPKEPDFLNDEFTRALAQILVTKLPQSIEAIDEFIEKIKTDL